MLKLHQKQQIFIFSLLLFMFILLPIPTSTATTIVTGQAQYQGRLEHSGIIIRFYDQATPLTITDLSGSFSLNKIGQGSHWLRVEAPLYLADLVEVTVNEDVVTFSSPIVIFGGDLNNDDKVGIADAALVGANFGLITGSADINTDNLVNIQDLAIIGGNFGKVTSKPPSSDDNHSIYLPIILR